MTMSLERNWLLREIAAHPRDDLPRLAYADYLEERDTCDRDRATAEFIRLTCGLKPPKRAKTKKCPDCSPDGNQIRVTATMTVLDGRITISESIKTAREACETCGGTGRVENLSFYTLYPKAAADWLRAGNWRRLVPLLTRDWDKATEGYYTDNQLPFEQWTSRQDLKAGVPVWMPGWVDGTEQLYRPVVRLSFGRGFVERASWRAPRLGLEIAKWLAEDQPLALQMGPGSIVPACPHMPKCWMSPAKPICNVPLFQGATLQGGEATAPGAGPESPAPPAPPPPEPPAPTIRGASVPASGR